MVIFHHYKHLISIDVCCSFRNPSLISVFLYLKVKKIWECSLFNTKKKKPPSFIKITSFKNVASWMLSNAFLSILKKCRTGSDTKTSTRFSAEYSFPCNSTFDSLKLKSTCKFIKIIFINIYQNLLVYIFQTLTYWYNYIPTQTEPVNIRPRQPGWYQGGKAERSVFADCLTFNRLVWCTENQWQLLLPTYVRKCHGNAHHIRDLAHKWTCPRKNLHCRIPHHLLFLSKNVPLPLLAAGSFLPWPIMGTSKYHCSKGNGLTQSWLNAQNCS